MRSALRSVRYWLPLLAACVALIAASWVSPAVAWLLVILAFGLCLDVGTALFAKAAGTGGLQDHRQ